MPVTRDELDRPTRALLAAALRLPRGGMRVVQALATAHPELQDLAIPLRNWPERHFRLDLRERVCFMFLRDGCIAHQGAEEAIVARVLQPGEVVFDVGANIGYVTVMLIKSIAPGGWVHSFEPSRRAFALLARNVEPGDPCSVLQAAVGERAGRIPFREQPELNVSSVAGANAPRKPKRSARHYDVDVLSLDQFCQQPGQRSPDFVKVDVEGYEDAVFRGMSRILAEKSPILLFECATPEQRAENIAAVEAAAPSRYRFARVAHDGTLAKPDAGGHVTHNYFGIPDWAADRFAGLESGS